MKIAINRSSCDRINSKAMTDAEIEALAAKIVAEVGKRTGGVLRARTSLLCYARPPRVSPGFFFSSKRSNTRLSINGAPAAM